MAKFLPFIFLPFLMPFAHAQSISYNQYNAVLAEINPAYIAQLEKNYVSLIGRMQWPGYDHGAQMGSFAFNKSFDRLHSSLGITTQALEYNKNTFSRKRLGLQYAYSVVFLDDLFLDLGVNLSLQEEKMSTPAFRDDFSPKRKFITFPGEISRSQSLRSDYGILLHPFDRVARWYAGFSVRNVLLQKLPGEQNIDQLPIYSAQAMKSISLTRRMNLYGFLMVEYHHQKYRADRAQILVNPFTSILLQANVSYREKITLGAGYKYFTSRYGSLCYRFSYTHHVTLGLSYDVKPYIQNDRIRAFSSYEIFLKYRINYQR